MRNDYFIRVISSKAKSANDSINHKEKCLMTLHVILDTVSADFSVTKMSLKTLKGRTLISAPNHVLTMKSGLVEIIVNAGETTPTLEKRKNEFGAGQVG